MSPLTAVLCIALFSSAYAGIFSTGRRSSDYQLAVNNYHSQQGIDASSRQTVNQGNAENGAQNDGKKQQPLTYKSTQDKPENNDKNENNENSASSAQQDANQSQTTPSEAPSTTESAPQQSPVSQVSNSAGSAVSYAYNRQSQHASSHVSQTLTSNLQAAYPAHATVTQHFTALPAPAGVAYYHPEEIHGEVVAVARDYPTYLQHERPRVVATHGAILTHQGEAITTYEPAGPATITHFTPVQSLGPVQPRPVKEQSFSVNVASAKYGYGYTVRGVQHAE